MRSDVGVSVSLQVDREDMHEYNDPAEDDDEVWVKYVESKAGSQFAVRIVLEPDFLYPQEDIVADVYVDGKMIAGDAAVKGASKEDLQGLGTVKVALTRCIRMEQLDINEKRGREANESKTISEKSLKGRAISNRISFAAKEKCRTANYHAATYPFGKKPFAEFKFKYRSRRDLQIEGILERSPSPTPLEERDPDTLTREELRQLLDRRNHELQDYNRIKREKRERSVTTGGAADDDDDDVTFTGSGPSKRHRVSDDSGVDIIDLTDD
ncbi:Hypothetical predicted protein [Lecanosticta acicola]|uniref:DUF7918 domain-containing protein n=1 Tax=Lecanosticta acicola TaxID=111012 RepID=A0AAI8YY57_9PEZI|nr:Hypothetical predicted protein [Lecanosticta acicola]